MGIRLRAGGVGQVFKHLGYFDNMLMDMTVFSGSVVFLDVLLELQLLLVVEAVLVSLGIAGVGN